jgi:hypothetical protein
LALERYVERRSVLPDVQILKLPRSGVDGQGLFGKETIMSGDTTQHQMVIERGEREMSEERVLIIDTIGEGGGRLRSGDL